MQYSADAAEAEIGRHAFSLDVQINNARPEAVLLLGHQWVVTDANGQLHVSTGRGIGDSKLFRLESRAAIRLRGA